MNGDDTASPDSRGHPRSLGGPDLRGTPRHPCYRREVDVQAAGRRLPIGLRVRQGLHLRREHRERHGRTMHIYDHEPALAPYIAVNEAVPMTFSEARVMTNPPPTLGPLVFDGSPYRAIAAGETLLVAVNASSDASGDVAISPPCDNCLPGSAPDSRPDPDPDPDPIARQIRSAKTRS